MKTKLFRLYENYMIVVGSLSSMVFYLQAYKIYIYQSANDVSLLAFSFGLISVMSWLFYGITLKNKALIASNILAVIGALLAVSCILIYS
ncbi:MAG: hypothetical protein JSS07_07015 [Proteobacteria bacterium]|nr:hypothetical protein [Pseudomonadota bacterium]